MSDTNSVNQRIAKEMCGDNVWTAGYDDYLPDTLHLIKHLRSREFMVTIIFDPAAGDTVCCHLENYGTWVGEGKNLQTAVCDAVIKYLDDKEKG